MFYRSPCRPWTYMFYSRLCCLARTCLFYISLCCLWACLFYWFYISLFCPLTCICSTAVCAVHGRSAALYFSRSYLAYSSLCFTWTSVLACAMPESVWLQAAFFHVDVSVYVSYCLRVLHLYVCFCVVLLVVSVYKSLCSTCTVFFCLQEPCAAPGRSVHNYSCMVYKRCFRFFFETVIFVSVVSIQDHNSQTNETNRVSGNKPKNNQNRLSFGSSRFKVKTISIRFEDTLFATRAYTHRT
jgi:hypothetical protein